MPTKPTAKLIDSKVLQPNAQDNKDSLTPENPFKQALGGSGKPQAPFGKQGHGNT